MSSPLPSPIVTLALYRRIDRANARVEAAHKELITAQRAVAQLECETRSVLGKRAPETVEARRKHQQNLDRREAVDLVLTTVQPADAWVPVGGRTPSETCSAAFCRGGGAWMCAYDVTIQLCESCFAKMTPAERTEKAQWVSDDTIHMQDFQIDAMEYLRRTDGYVEPSTTAYRRAVTDTDAMDQWRLIARPPPLTLACIVGTHATDAHECYVLAGQPTVVLCAECYATRVDSPVVRRAVQQRVEAACGQRVQVTEL